MTHNVKLASLHGSHLSEPILTISTRLFSFHTRVSLNVCSEENYSWIVESSAVHAQVLCLYHFVKFCFHICLLIYVHTNEVFVLNRRRIPTTCVRFVVWRPVFCFFSCMILTTFKTFSECSKSCCQFVLWKTRHVSFNHNYRLKWFTVLLRKIIFEQFFILVLRDLRKDPHSGPQ